MSILFGSRPQLLPTEVGESKRKKRHSEECLASVGITEVLEGKTCSELSRQRTSDRRAKARAKQ